MTFRINKRIIGPNQRIFVVPDIGINHYGSFTKAKQMIAAAKDAGAECVKFQLHILNDEMAPAAKKIIPGNAKKSIWHVIAKSNLTVKEHIALKKYAESLGLIYLCTPFSRAAADILHKMNVRAFKIGSGECNHYPLVDHIARYRKPIILSTGMNDLKSISTSVKIIKKHRVPLALMHCVSMYPTPYDQVNLSAMTELQKKFQVPVGLSDHSLRIYTVLGAVALGASVVEKHFTLTRRWPGEDILISIEPAELTELIKGAEALRLARGGSKRILTGEQPTINFAYSSLVVTRSIQKGERFTKDNLWAKRPGIGIPAAKYWRVIGKIAKRDIIKDELLKKGDY